MSNVVNLTAARRRRAMTESAKYDGALAGQSGPPEWQNDIQRCCSYARIMKAEHALERERITFAMLDDEVPWWEATAEIQAQVHENNRRWDAYIALCRHIAELPAATRREAQQKRHTIGPSWLKPGNTSLEAFDRMREGCLADDHLFPPSLKLARKSTRRDGGRPSQTEGLKPTAAEIGLMPSD